MLSSVSKLFEKSFVLGYLLPSLLAVFTALQLVGCPERFSTYCTVSVKDPFANLTYIALLVYIVAILLLSVNGSAYRIFEGYRPPTKWLYWLKDWHVRRFRALTAQRAKCLVAGQKHDASVIRQQLFAAYPTNEGHILPTAFGNALRAFEVYSKDVYGADAIPVWLRLSGVIPKSFQDLINDAKSQVDLFVNVALLSALFGTFAWIRFVIEVFTAHPPAWPGDGTKLVWVGVGGIVVAYGSYRWAIVQTRAWGDLVKSAFDLYLPALGKQLGYTLPSTESGRRAFWLAFTKLALYRRQFADGTWTLTAAETPKPEKSSEPSEDKDKDEKGNDGEESDADASSDDGDLD